MRVEPSTLSYTIDKYNGFVKNEKDLDFNRQSLSTPLTEGPFYAIEVIPGVHYCMGGIVINTNAQVIADNQVPIPGLFAAGEATGGIHGLNRLGGNSLLDAIVYGRIAGKNASNASK
ncbi:FAD-binding protein [Proteinivorax hydrogeniformans]|uniref:FAD-binding protein n=1 Tax=Proteinivorax hydrogeniformans TaxID=1826727 RepID=A0AAU8HX43_9FIRM